MSSYILILLKIILFKSTQGCRIEQGVLQKSTISLQKVGLEKYHEFDNMS
jgi:hypothetical protein